MLIRRLAAIAVALFAAPIGACACTCATPGPTPCGGLGSEQISFVGTVIDVENPPPDEFGPNVDTSGTSRYRFRVDERIVGVDAAEIDVYSGRGGADCSFHFKQGEQYLVFPYRAEDGRLQATVCSETRRIDYAGALLSQLHAMRDGRPVASLFGILRSRQKLSDFISDDDVEKALAGRVLQLRGEGTFFQTRSDASGVYAFYNIPTGKYRIWADLPAHYELAQTDAEASLPSVELPMGACYEYDVDAAPTGLIRGSVVGPDGKPLPSAAVELFRAERYDEGAPRWRAWWDYQGEEGFFEFKHLGPGRYILVYNRDNRRDPDSPYPRTFYPAATSLESAGIIELREGDELLDANIHVTGAAPTRKLIVHVTSQGGKLPANFSVTAKADKGESPFPRKIALGTYEFTLIRATHYIIAGVQSCGHRWEGNIARPNKPLQTNVVVVDGSDDAISEITLLFPAASCPD